MEAGANDSIDNLRPDPAATADFQTFAAGSKIAHFFKEFAFLLLHIRPYRAVNPEPLRPVYLHCVLLAP